jgi:hypothetical protein
MTDKEMQEPVAIGWDTKTDTPIMGYTTPPAAQRTWIGLTEAEKRSIEKKHIFVEDAIRLTEAKLKEKNT